MKNTAALAALYALASIPTALAAPGDLDPTFGQAGRVFVDIEDDNDWPAGLALQPDGRIVVGRGNENEADDFSVLRFHPDGSRDTSFDRDGRTSLDIPNIRGTTHSVLLQPDGKVVAVGWARESLPSFTRLALARYLANGSPDVSFGNRGVVLSDAYYDGLNLSALLLPDGRFVVAGHVDKPALNTRTTALARFDPDGSLDESFGEGGYAYSTGSTREWATQLLRQPDGKLLVFMDAEVSARKWYDWRPTILRFNPDGSRDATFGEDGRASLMDEASFSSAVVQSDGKILVAAANWPYYWDIAYCGAVLTRVHTDGRLDDSFGSAGEYQVSLGGCESFGAAMLIAPDGKIDLNGSRSTSHIGSSTIDSSDHVVTRLNPSGERDTSFGIDGQAVLDVGDGRFMPYAYSSGDLVRQDDGKLLVLTTGIKAFISWGGNNRLMLARLLASGGSPGLIGIKAVDPQVMQDDKHIEILVRRSGGSEGRVSVDYSTTVGGPRGTLTWEDGNREDKTITLDVSERYTLSLANVTGGAGLATSEIQIPEVPPRLPDPQAPAEPAAHSGGGGAMSWEFLLAIALGVLVMCTKKKGG